MLGHFVWPLFETYFKLCNTINTYGQKRSQLGKTWHTVFICGLSWHTPLLWEMPMRGRTVTRNLNVKLASCCMEGHWEPQVWEYEHKLVWQPSSSPPLPSIVAVWWKSWGKQNCLSFASKNRLWYNSSCTQRDVLRSLVVNTGALCEEDTYTQHTSGHAYDKSTRFAKCQIYKSGPHS